MAMKRCDQGHYYEASQHSSCPHCGIVDLLQPPGPTAKAPNIQAGSGAGIGSSSAATVGRGHGRDHGGKDGRTIGIIPKKLGVDPVVGWLVCVEGPDRGRDYRIRSGRNFIGRDESMHIAIRNDEGISRHKHAVLSYDPRKGLFKLLAGESAGLAYVNDETVDVAVELKPFDTIELGETKLKFVPFCGEQFQWMTEADGPSA